MVKALFIPIAFLIFSSCSQSQNKGDSEAKEVKEDCTPSVAVGRVKICLPEIDSMVEAYNDSIVKSWADKHEIKGNTVLSFFLRNPTFYGTNAAGEKTYDDFFKIFQVDMLKDMDLNEDYLDEVGKSISTANTFHNWGDTQLQLAKDNNFIPPNQPYFIDRYSPHPHVRSFVMLYRYNTSAFEPILIGVMNIMFIKKRIVGLTYYKTLMGLETLDKAKKRNDFIVGKVMAVNGE